MKLWILSPITPTEVIDINHWYPWYDKAFGFVVRAETEKTARDIAADNAGDEIIDEINPWLDPNLSKCEELSLDGDERLIMRDFWAA